MKTIDLRSDTVTRPTPEMREAMMKAPVGDDVFEDDPTVNELQAKVAGMFGVEAALFVPSGSMGNQVCLYTHSKPGYELICDDNAHIDWYEVAAPAALSRLLMRPIPSNGGVPDPDLIEAAIRPVNIHSPETGIISVENTHNRHGGVIVPLAIMRRIAAIGAKHNVKCHLDGARIWNAHAATGVPLADWVVGFDSVSVCFSKGLGAPIGSAILGTREFVTRARRTRKMFGGGMRQVGIIAAAAIWAIDHQLPKLGEDHRRARRLAEQIARVPGVRLIPDPPPTNIVVIDVSERKIDTEKALARMKEQGVLIVPFGPGRLRAVANRDVDDDAIEVAAEVIRKTLAA
ncbi:MAG TPA: GntG family PLP-dependent aldolase [Acidobacteriota bacterium]|nr:GntG family PLP-dependent aldolase [Acidobacteriota bacterium]